MATAKKTPEQIRAEEEASEWSTYVAVSPIPHGNAIAYQPGHPVPVSNVELYRYHDQGLVKKVRGEERVQAEAAHTSTPDPL